MRRSSILPILAGALSFSSLPSVVEGWSTTTSTSMPTSALSHSHVSSVLQRGTKTNVTPRHRSLRCRGVLSATIAGDDILRLENDFVAPQDGSDNDDDDNNNNNNNNEQRSIPTTSLLSYTFDELAEHLGGTGKAKACWDCLRLGIDPIWYYGKKQPPPPPQGEDIDDNDNEPTGSALLQGWSRDRAREQLARVATRGSPTQLGGNTLRLLERLGGDNTVEDHVCKLSQISVSPDGTTKLLLQLVEDGLEVETVIIPWEDRGKSTLCVSSQVGCRQGCTFCSTGRMGRLRSLSTAEILGQMYWANKICRLSASSTTDNDNDNEKRGPKTPLYPIDNCVFMGMGEPADNAPAVIRAATTMADSSGFQLAPRKITISTVAPHPGVFGELAEAPVVLAWSVHSSRDEIRRQLVPTTKHSMEELRDGLLETLRGRSKRLRNTMLEVTLLDGINDSTADAEHLAGFCAPFLRGSGNSGNNSNSGSIKLTVNLIPWNDISATFGPASDYRPPKPEKVRAYQKVLAEHGILCYVRTTRGDEENAACGMLSTKKRNKNNNNNNNGGSGSAGNAPTAPVGDGTADQND